VPNSRDGQRMGDWKMVDTMIVDGLWDVYNQYHMGITAENVAKEKSVSRAAGCAGAGQPAKGCGRAGCRQVQGRNRSREIPQRKGDPIVFDSDEYVNRKTNADVLATLKPAFDKAGSVTAGNAWSERRRCRRGGDDRRQGQGPGPEASGQDRVLRHQRPGS
jgi:acetyl-CoA C-acetyltransferase